MSFGGGAEAVAAGALKVELVVEEEEEGGKRGAGLDVMLLEERGDGLNGDPLAAPPKDLEKGESELERVVGWIWGVEGASTIIDPDEETFFFGGGPERDLRADDDEGVSASGREGVDPQGVAAKGAGGTTAGEGGAEVAAPKLKDEGDPPLKLKGEAAAGLGVEGAAPKMGTAGEGFGEEKMLDGTAAKGLGAAGVLLKEKGVEEEEGGADPNPVDVDAAPPPKVKAPPKAGLDAGAGCKSTKKVNQLTVRGIEGEQKGGKEGERAHLAVAGSRGS